MAGTYKVEYLETTPATDITEYIHTIDDVALFSDGRISNAKITLQASFGQFMSDNFGTLTPLVDQFERFKFTFTDSDGSIKTKILELTTNLAQLTLQGEYLLPLEFQGRERHLAYVPFSGFYDVGVTHFDMIENILVSYLYDRGTLQPTMLTQDGATETNELPKFNPNVWDFQYIDNCLDAIKEVVKHANNSVSAGGAGDRYAIIFDDDPLDPPTPSTPGNIIIRIISQGSRNSAVSPKPIIVNTLAEPIKKVDKIKQQFTGTKVIARGRRGSGRTPIESDLYRGRLEFWLNIPQYSATKQYAVGAHVDYGTAKYRCILLPPGIGFLPTNVTYWVVETIGNYIGQFNYSPLTHLKAAAYRNNGGNPGVAFSSLSLTSPKTFDCNIVINDTKTQRDWVIFRSNTDVVGSLTADQKKYLWNETSYYEGFRMLLDDSLGALAGTFAAGTDSYGMGAGKDPRGIPFLDNTVVYANIGGAGSKWYVFNNPNPANPDVPLTTPTDYQQIVVIYEGKLYEWNVNFTPGGRVPAQDNRKRGTAGTPDGWRDISGEFLGNECWHSPSLIENTEGLITPRIKTGSVEYTDNSAVRITYGFPADNEFETQKSVLDKILGLVVVTGVGWLGTLLTALGVNAFLTLSTPRYQNFGWWWTMAAPFPFSTFNAIGEKVGELIGGSTLTELNNHPYFDAYNQKTSLNGNFGWTGSDATQMMEITGCTFLFKLNISVDAVNIPYTGDIPMSYWVIDNNGTIWKSKQTYRFLGDVQRFTFEFGDFTPVYRARTPFGIYNIVENITVPELEIRERLFANRIKFQGFMCESAYDEHGRYFPNAWEQVIKPTVVSLFTGNGGTVNILYDGIIDDFAWTKTPIAISASDAESAKRNIFPEIKDFPNVTNLEQLQRIADAELDIEEFPYEQYTIIQNDKADMELQDTIYIQEDEIINEEDKAGTPHTREVVIGEYHLSITNEHDFKRTLVLPRRIPKK